MQDRVSIELGMPAPDGVSIAGALLDRRAGGGESAPDAAGIAPDFEAQVAARVIVAAFRSALIRHRELQASGEDSPGFRVLLGQAFAVVTGQGLVTAAPPASRELHRSPGR
jgi:hypothetical protein